MQVLQGGEGSSRGVTRQQLLQRNAQGIQAPPQQLGLAPVQVHNPGCRAGAPGRRLALQHQLCRRLVQVLAVGRQRLHAPGWTDLFNALACGSIAMAECVWR